MKITCAYSIILKGKIKIWVFSLLFISIGILFAFLLPGIIAGSNEDSVYTTGKVSDVRKIEEMYFTTVEFKTEKGSVVKTESSTSSNYNRGIGSEVSIIYNKNNINEISFLDDFRIMILIFKILGWIILIIGGTVFLLSIISVFIKINSPENEDTFFWWINFTGGMMGALFFAIPSTFIYLLFFLLPDDVKLQAQNTSILLPIFTLVGIAVDIAIFFIARYQLKDRPMWKSKFNQLCNDVTSAETGSAPLTSKL